MPCPGFNVESIDVRIFTTDIDRFVRNNGVTSYIVPRPELPAFLAGVGVKCVDPFVSCTSVNRPVGNRRGRSIDTKVAPFALFDRVALKSPATGPIITRNRVDAASIADVDSFLRNGRRTGDWVVGSYTATVSRQSSYRGRRPHSSHCQS